MINNMFNKRKIINKIIFFAKQYKVSSLILFGSFLDDDIQANDIDLACDGINDWKLYELASKIEDDLNISIELIPLTPASKFTKYITKRGKVLI